jgi:hypothetical protein
MTREEIIKLARKAGIAKHGLGWTCWEGQLERFAALVAAAERKECAKICADIAMHRDVGAYGMLVAHSCANEILERGSA